MPDRRGPGAAEPDRAGRRSRDHRVPLLRQQRAPDGDAPGPSPTRWTGGPAPTAGCSRATRSAWWTPTAATCPTGRDGEILTRGPELFAGYTDPALNAAAFLPGGWFRTGDVGRVDADGYLTVTDRLKDIIIRGGENISAKEVEDLLVTHPAVADVAVIPVPDPALGERVCAVVVARPGHTFDVEQAREHFAAAGAARQKTPEVVVLVDELPRTPSGKVRKDVLRAAKRAGADG